MDCLECEEYNHEKYYCPKYCEVIRGALKEAIPVSYIEETIAWAKENGSDEYADYLAHLLSIWAERNDCPDDEICF